jgi:hypothetical protein
MPHVLSPLEQPKKLITILCNRADVGYISAEGFVIKQGQCSSIKSRCEDCKNILLVHPKLGSVPRTIGIILKVSIIESGEML